jgi:hypothetical protein
MTADELPAVYCPFAADLRCPTDPPCPTLRDRVCVNALRRGPTLLRDRRGPTAGGAPVTGRHRRTGMRGLAVLAAIACPAPKGPTP